MRTRICVFVALLTAVASVPSAPAGSRRQTAAEQEVQSAFDRYVDAWKRGDMKAWASVYVTDHSLSSYWPDGFRPYPIKGWQNVSKALAEVAGLIGGMDLAYTERQVEVYGDTAILTAKWVWNDIEHLKTPVSPKARKALLTGRGTFIFVRREPGWLVVHEHSSVPWKPERGDDGCTSCKSR